MYLNDRTGVAAEIPDSADLTAALADSQILVQTSVAVLAEMSLSSPRKLFIFIIKKCIYRIKVSKNKLIYF